MTDVQHESVEKLVKHGLRYRFNGFPIFDDEGEIEAIIVEPEWEWSDLTPEQLSFLKAKAEADMEKHGVSSDLALWAAASDHGITCPHRWINHEPHYRECARCRSWQQLPGKVVEVGGKLLRVQDPPPMRLKIPKASRPSAWLDTMDEGIQSMTIEVDEYEWNGYRYILRKDV